MAVKIYLGAAEKKQDMITIAIGGTIEVGDLFKVQIGTGVVQIAATTTSAATTATELLAALQAATAPPMFAEVTWSLDTATITGLGPTDGRPVSQAVSVATTESDGGAADAQTITLTVVQEGTGPKDYKNTANWSGSALPGNGDEIHFGLYPFCPEHNIDGQDAVTPTAIYVHSGPTDGLMVGLPQYNSTGGYAEYLPTHLEIKASAVYVGIGNGAYVPKISVNTLDAGGSLYVYRSELRADDGTAPVNWLTTASSTVADCRGALDLGTYAGQAPVLGTVTQQGSAADVRIGKDATTVTLSVLGGVLNYEAADAPTTVNVKAGAICNLAGSGNTITTVTYERGSRVNWRRKSGTVTNVVGAGTWDMSEAVDGTFTNVDLYSGYVWNDPNKVGTYTNGIDCHMCDSTKVNVGQDVRVTPGAVS